MSEQEGNLKGRIEAILFVAGEAVSIKELTKVPGKSTGVGCHCLLRRKTEITVNYQHCH